MSEEVMTNFSKLPIWQASITTIFAESRSKLVLRLALEDCAARYVDIYELQFTGVANVVIDAVGMPWFGKISGCEASAVDAVDTPQGEPSAMWEARPLTRFVITSSQEQFEVIAEQYAFARLERVVRAPKR